MKGFKTLQLLIPILLMLLCMNVGGNIYKYDVENNQTTDIYNLTETTFDTNKAGLNIVKYNSSEHTGDFQNIRISNVAKYTLNGFLNVLYEFSSMFVEIGYNSHIDFDMYLVVTLFQIVCYAIIISFLFKPAIFIAGIMYSVTKVIVRNIKLRK